MLYYDNPYLREAEFRVVEREGNRILLNDTILYPGGGGQPEDYGRIVCENGSFPVRHVGNLWHEVEGECRGERVKIILDWERRYLLMRSHTAEHTFFRILENMGARMGKISLGEVSSILFYGEIDVEAILESERETRRLIREGREVRSFWIRKEELKNYPNLRIKLERIKEDSIRVVEIEGHDLSACKGIHVGNLKEIGDFAILSFRMGKRKEVKFSIGERAAQFHEEISQEFRRLTWPRNLDAEKFGSYLRNLEEENARMRKALKEVSSVIPFNMEKCGDVSIQTISLPGGDFKTLQRRAMEMVNHGGAIALLSLEGTVAVAFSHEFSWVRDSFLSLLNSRGGRGGGKGNFVSGRDENPEEFVEELKKIICQEIIRLHGDSNGYD